MSFWGMSGAGKDASGKLNEIPNWYWQQAQDSWGRGNDQYQFGQGTINDYLAYLQNAKDTGVGTPQDIRATGEQIMPGVDEAIANRQDRTNRLRGIVTQMRDAGATTDQISNWIDQYGGSILTDSDTTASDIRDTFGRVSQAADRYGTDRVNNIRDVYSGANKVLDESQAGMTGRTGSTYGGLIKNLDPAFAAMQGRLDEQQKLVDQFKPGSEARGARVGRSFNPATASVMARLRRGGIDPTSPEGIASLARVDLARATAMDDSLAADTERYVNASGELKAQANNLDLNKLSQLTGLSLGQLQDLNSLDTAYGDKKIGLGLGQGQDFRTENANQEATQRGLDLGRLQLNTDNTNRTGNRLDTYFTQRANLPLTQYGLQQQDYATQLGLEDRANTDDLTGLGLKNEQFNQGMGYTTTDLGRRDQAASAAGQVGSQAMDRSGQWTQLGNQQGAAAQQGYQNTFNNESANAGWGKKLILGGVGAGLNLIAPGAGSLVTGLASGNPTQINSGATSLWNKINPSSSGGFLKTNPTAGGGYNLGVSNPFIKYTRPSSTQSFSLGKM